MNRSQSQTSSPSAMLAMFQPVQSPCQAPKLSSGSAAARVPSAVASASRSALAGHAGQPGRHPGQEGAARERAAAAAAYGGEFGHRRGELSGPQRAAPPPDRQRVHDEHLAALPSPVVQHPRHGQPAQVLGGQCVQRGPFGPDQVPGQRVDADLGEPGRLAAGGEQLQHRLAVSPGRAQVRADQHLVAEDVLQVRLDRVGAVRNADPQPAAEARRGRAAGTGPARAPGCPPRR